MQYKLQFPMKLMGLLSYLVLCLLSVRDISIHIKGKSVKCSIGRNIGSLLVTSNSPEALLTPKQR